MTPDPVGCVIQIMGDARGGRPPPVPTYVGSCDVDARDGVGVIIFTQNRSEALHFDNMGAAFDFYRKQSKIRPLRDDGRPNRPLTAFHACILKDGAEPY